jgi:hypothetical protein
MALVSISNYCGRNLGGLSSLLYIPHEWVNEAAYNRIVSALHNWQEAITLEDETDWLTMPLLHRGRSFSENSLRSEQGNYYEPTIEGIIPNLRPAVTGLLEEMENYRYLVRLTDRNGKPWLIGTLDAPLSFRAEATGGGDSALNNYRIAFSAQAPRRMYGYIPV